MANPTPKPSDDDVGRLLKTAHKWVRRKITGNPELAERCQDKATDAILFSLKHWDGVQPWDRFAWAMIHRFVREQLANHSQRRQPPILSRIRKDEDIPDLRPESQDALSLDAATRLNPDLLDAVRMVYVEGLTLREAAQRRGVSYEMIRKRLRSAAERLGGLPHRPRSRRSSRKAVPCG